MSVAAIIPVWNEAGAIAPTIAALPRRLIQHIVVVDGGSTDGTQAEAQAAGATVITQSRRGYGAACAEGATHAEALGATVLLFLDGDGADAAERSADLLTPLLQNTADFTIATRAFREPGSMLWHQVLAGHLIGRAVGLATGTTYKDMAAFRALGVETLHRLGMRQMTYGWNLEMQMRAAALHLRILQIDMPYRRRIAGQSKVAGTVAGTLKASWRILATLLSIARELRARRP
jgi:glycosyltransferase involved in cell wall biosynthesis